MRRSAIIVPCFLVVFQLSCGQKAAVVPPEPAPLSVDAGPYAGHVGRFLAGIPGKPGDPFHDLESSAAWTAHSSALQKMWAKYESDRLPALRSFQSKEISGGAFSSETLFYPFGGPDVLTSVAFFPQRKTYLLVGLEPPGTIPGERAIRRADLNKFMPRMQMTLDSVLRRSFFITANMDAQVRGQVTDGLLPLMLAQLALMNAEIIGVRAVTLDERGTIIGRTVEKRPASSLRNDGVAIDFQPAGEVDVRRLLYFSVNLNDEALARNAAFRAYLEKLRPVTTFFKSASYLPHRKDFSSIRGLVLETSRAIVQDDTGIPYRFIDPAQWQVKLYGQYTRPYGSFRFMVQPDLKKAYDGGQASPLGFYIGYGFGRAPSAIQVFAKRS